MGSIEQTRLALLERFTTNSGRCGVRGAMTCGGPKTSRGAKLDLGIACYEEVGTFWPAAVPRSTKTLVITQLEDRSQHHSARLDTNLGLAHGFRLQMSALRDL